MKRVCVFFMCLLSTASIFGQAKDHVLLFTKTAGFRHESIPKGVQTVTRLLDSVKINVTHTEDSKYFCADSLAKFKAVIFLNTTGDILSADQKAAFQKFIQSGKGYVGIHAASDTEYNWPWYGQLVGGYFVSHPEVQDANVHVLNAKHISTKHLKNVWTHKDEWYDYRDVKDGLNILMTVDEGSYKGGKMGQFHPIAWFQKFDGGRSFYTGLGHTNEAYDLPEFQKHIIGGVFYVLDRKK